jgi:NAD(P)H dehydrogenase (quinone)
MYASAASASSSSLIAVSTGQLGHLVLSHLLEGGFPAARLVALVRTASKARERSDKGVSVREVRARHNTANTAEGETATEDLDLKTGRQLALSLPTALVLLVL